MNEVWIYIQVFSIAFVLILILVAVTNTKNFKRLEDYPQLSRCPKVSILIPARNEENNIAACVVSLLDQNYPDFEVIVLDDDSNDRTWSILQSLETRGHKLKIIKGAPLPPGWIGKHWACHQLAMKASGELLLFTDADTRHHPETLNKSVSAFYTEDADFLTALPREEAHTIGEKLTIPIMSFGISSFLPMKIAHRSSSPILTLTVGQFMMFRRNAYKEVGGYEGVKHCVLDDVELGRKIKTHGLQWRIVDAQNFINCRMYTNLFEVYEGFSKNLFATFGESILLYLPTWIWLSLVFIFPVIVLGLGMSGANIPQSMIILALITTGCSLVLWGITHIRFRYPLYLTFLYPISVLLWVIMAMRSMLMTIAGQNTWKGRSLDIVNESADESEESEEYRRRHALD